MTLRAAAVTHQSGQACPGCDYATEPYDRVRDACPNCGLISTNEARAVRYVKRVFRAHEEFTYEPWWEKAPT